jgi:uncharacterized membrane protein
MSDQPSAVAVPRRRIPWFTILLVASLALNLLVGGAIAARFVFPERIERLMGIEAQLVPRRFLADLSRERRKELLAVIKSYRASFKDGREQLRTAASGLADALAAEPYDAAKTLAAINTVEQAGQGMIAQGSKLAVDVIGGLQPDERKALAQRLRERSSRKK